jgi:D-alanyl-D-alanine carboxypeptidase
LVKSYWDRYTTAAIENCSELQKVNVSSLIGDDGMIASPLDYVKFLSALFNNRILAESSMTQMLTFVPDGDDENQGYGLGIQKDVYNQKIMYGHGGDGIGSGCYLSYFPHNNTFAFVAINIGTTVNSPIFDKTATLVDRIFDVLIQE